METEPWKGPLRIVHGLVSFGLAVLGAKYLIDHDVSDWITAPLLLFLFIGGLVAWVN
jgi:hypothetical protein